MSIKKYLYKIIVLSLLLSFFILSYTPNKAEAKSKIPTYRINLFVGENFIGDKSMKVNKISNKKLVKSGKDENGNLTLTAKKAGTVTITLKKKNKKTNIKMIISSNKDKCISLKLGNIIGSSPYGAICEAYLTNTSKIPLTKAELKFKNATLLEYYNDSAVYCLIPNKKIKIYLILSGNKSDVSLSQQTLTYKRFSTYTDITNKIKLDKRLESSSNEVMATFFWKSKPTLSKTESSDFALDITGYDNMGLPVKTRYIGGDINTLNTITYTYTSTNGLQGSVFKAVTRAVVYKDDSLKWG